MVTPLSFKNLEKKIFFASELTDVFWVSKIVLSDEKLTKLLIGSELCRYICKGKNFIYLNGQDVGQPGVLEIVGGFIDQRK